MKECWKGSWFGKEDSLGFRFQADDYFPGVPPCLPLASSVPQEETGPHHLGSLILWFAQREAQEMGGWEEIEKIGGLPSGPAIPLPPPHHFSGSPL